MISLVQIQLPRADCAAPAAEFHLVRGTRRVLFAINGSRLYLLDDLTGEESIPELIPPLVSGVPVAKLMDEPAALSINIAQSCNLGCAYCYADEGRFGGEARLMTFDTARRAIDRHIRNAEKGPVSLGFIGGEPLLNRHVLHDAARYAWVEAGRNGIPITFGITTNATLLQPADIELLRSYAFAVTVSLDGGRETHDKLRPARNGTSSFDRAMSAVAPLLAAPGRARVAARVTITRENLDVGAHLDALAHAGFQEIGVSPMRTGPRPELRIEGADWVEFTSRMREAAQVDWLRVLHSGGPLRFSNFSTALRQLYRGACNALPCGAAASYVSLSAEGRYYTCHRTIGDDEFELGDLQNGPSPDLRRGFVTARSVDRQTPCRTCWARYLCGGGCHAEVMRVGRAGCDSIREWLEFCISIYPEVLIQRPDLLTAGASFGIDGNQEVLL